jgi:hypothetical protein
MTDAGQRGSTSRDLAPTPELLISWLRQDGWVERGRNGTSAVFDRSTDSSVGQVMVPLRRELTDYAEAAEAVIAKAAAVVGRPIWIIRAEMLAGAARDLVTVQSDSAEPGVVSLLVGSGLFSGAHHLLLASAASAIERRPVFEGARLGRAEAYLRNVQATVRAGSFNVVLSCPLAGPSAESDPDAAPFGRRVTSTLARSMATVVELAQDRPGIANRLTAAGTYLRSGGIPEERAASPSVSAVVTVVGQVVSLERGSPGQTAFKMRGRLIPETSAWTRRARATVQVNGPGMDETFLIEAFRTQTVLTINGPAVRRGRSTILTEVWSVDGE